MLFPEENDLELPEQSDTLAGLTESDLTTELCSIAQLLALSQTVHVLWL